TGNAAQTFGPGSRLVVI
uniref:Uncharacterized protein n=1 Tax=Sarcophilus harrisii TaxID=9305 RepID=A0A7N4NHW8_SARHA